MEFLIASLMINIFHIIICLSKLLEYLNIIISINPILSASYCMFIDSIILVEGIGQNDNIITYVHSLHLNKWLIRYFWSYM